MRIVDRSWLLPMGVVYLAARLSVSPSGQWVGGAVASLIGLAVLDAARLIGLMPFIADVYDVVRTDQWQTDAGFCQRMRDRQVGAPRRVDSVMVA